MGVVLGAPAEEQRVVAIMSLTGTESSRSTLLMYTSLGISDNRFPSRAFRRKNKHRYSYRDDKTTRSSTVQYS